MGDFAIALINQAFSCSQIEKIETLWYYDLYKSKIESRWED